jgi:hypothetical protein
VELRDALKHLNRSPKTWDTDPLPDDPMLIWLGLALA